MAGRKYPTIFKIFILLGGLAIALSLGAYWAAPGLIERHFFDPETRAQFHAWEKDKIHLPAGALALPPFLPATREDSSKFIDAWKLQREQAKSLFDDLHGTEPLVSKRIDPEALNYPDLERRLELFQPVMAAFAELVSQPDYSIPAAASGQIYDLTGQMPYPDYFAIQTNIKLLGLRVYCQVHHGKCDEAEKTVRLMLRATCVDPYDHIISTLIAVAGVSITADAVFDLVRHCEDRALLQRILEIQTEYARHPIMFPDNVALDIVTSIGHLRQLRRRGIGPDFQDKTGYELTMMCLRGDAEYIQKIVLPNTQHDPEANKAAREELQRHKTGRIDHSTPIVQTLAKCLIYDMAKPNRKEAETRAVIAAAKFDLLALETAKKLFTLEHGKPPAAMGDLVPQYLPQIPRDRLGETAVLKATPERFYSIGPDKVDDHAALMYDPTNGAISAGDLFFEK